MVNAGASGRVLALDVGDRRIGIACSYPTGMLATPLGVWRRQHLDQDVHHIARLMAEEVATLVVIGLPVNMDGTEGPQAAKTRAFGDALAARGVAVEFWDERLT